jgi:hypothetical protein
MSTNIIHPRCTALSSDGSPCGADALPGKALCCVHDPAEATMQAGLMTAWGPSLGQEKTTWKEPSDPTYKPNRKRDQMTPEEHEAYKARIKARGTARRGYSARTLASAISNAASHQIPRGPRPAQGKE